MPKVLLITGISTGIGQSFVEIASKAYPKDTIVALTRHKLAYVLPSNVVVYNIDITDFNKTNALIKKVVKKHGEIDILINNAGNGTTGTIEDTTINEAKAQLELNVWAAVNLIQQVLPAMRHRKSGHIINISSVAATLDYPTMAYYGASKTLLEKLSRILAMEVKAWNITISTIAPGTIKTKFGENMTEVEKSEHSSYEEVYKKWSSKFADMFKKTISSDDVAQMIIKMINRPRPATFVIRRDAIYSKIKEIIPYFFNDHLINKYMNTKDRGH